VWNHVGGNIDGVEVCQRGCPPVSSVSESRTMWNITPWSCKFSLGSSQVVPVSIEVEEVGKGDQKRMANQSYCLDDFKWHWDNEVMLNTYPPIFLMTRDMRDISPFSKAVTRDRRNDQNGTVLTLIFTFSTRLVSVLSPLICVHRSISVYLEFQNSGLRKNPRCN
jgi:hypothetical protein